MNKSYLLKYNFWILLSSSVLAGLLLCKVILFQTVPIPDILPADLSRLSIISEATHQPFVSPWVDETFIRGLFHQHSQKKTHISSFEDTLGGGVCVADFNNDGWDDVYFVTGSGNLRHFGKASWWTTTSAGRLYLNHQGQYFVDKTDLFGLSGQRIFGIACASADLDGDGYADLILGNKGINLIYKNIKGERMELMPTPFDKKNDQFTTSILVKDFNVDGKQDILFGNYVAFTQEQNTLELSAGFDTRSTALFDASFYDAQPDTLYINQSSFKYTYSEGLNSLNKHGRTLGFFEMDYILALNDKGSPSQSIWLPSVASNTALNNTVFNARDGEMILGPDKHKTSLFLAADATKAGVYAINADNAEDRSWDFNINSMGNLFSVWSILVEDFNNDGHDDIFLANGHNGPHPDAPQVVTPQPNLYLRANPDREQFDPMVLNNNRLLSARGAATFDFDHDGDMDIIINNNNDFPTLLVNHNAINANQNVLSLYCVPQHLCDQANLQLKNEWVTNPFKADQAFASQSHVAYRPTHLNVSYPLTFNLSVNDIKKSYSVDRPGSYRINLTDKSIHRYSESTTTNIVTLLNRETFIANLRLNKFDDSFVELQFMLKNAPVEDQHIILDEIIHSKSILGFALADYWAKSQDLDIAEKAIEALRVLEMEASMPGLIALLNSSEDRLACASARALQYFYWKDEAVIERKHMAESKLIDMLNSNNQTKILCAVDALAESESFRALNPLLKRLGSASDLVKGRIIRALGRLRQGSAAPAIWEIVQSSHLSPYVMAESLVALDQLKWGWHWSGVLQKIDHQPSEYSQFLFAFLMRSEEGLASLSKLKTLPAESREALKEWEGLSVEELLELYTINQQLYSDTQGKLNFMDEIKKGPTSWPEIKGVSQDRIHYFYQQLISSDKSLNRPSILKALACLNFTDAEVKPSAKMDDRKRYEGVRHCLTSGYYQPVAAVANNWKDQSFYPNLFNQLMYDKQLQSYERFRVIADFPWDEKNIRVVQDQFENFSVEEQLSLLRVLNTRIEPVMFMSFLQQISEKSTSDILKQFIRGRLNFGVHNE